MIDNIKLAFSAVKIISIPIAIVEWHCPAVYLSTIKVIKELKVTSSSGSKTAAKTQVFQVATFYIFVERRCSCCIFMSRLYYRYISINHHEPPEPVETGSLCLNKHLGQYLFYFIGSVITVTFWRKTLKFTEQLSFTTSQTWSWAATMQNRHEMAAVVRHPSCPRASNWKDWHMVELVRTAHARSHQFSPSTDFLI